MTDLSDLTEDSHRWLEILMMRTPARTLACVPHSITRVHGTTSLPGYQWEGVDRVSRNMKIFLFGLTTVGLELAMSCFTFSICKIETQIFFLH